MDTEQIKAEVDKNVEKLEALKDEARLQAHLASLDAKKEWDEKIEPRLLEAEQAAKSFTESSRTAVKEAITKLEDFLHRLHGKPPHSTK